MKSKLVEVLTLVREFVADRDYRETPVLTAYVNVDTTNADNRREQPAWLIELKNEARRLEEGLDPEELKRRAVQNQWDDTVEMLLQHLRDHKPSGRSAAIFTDHNDFLDIELPVPVSTRLHYGLPQIKQLLFAVDQYKKYLVVLLSGSEVRALDIFLTRATQDVRVDTEHQFAGRLGYQTDLHPAEIGTEEFQRRFVREVAHAINEYFMRDPEIERLILGGNQKQAHAVKNALRPEAREALVAIESIDFKLPQTEIAKQVLQIAGRHELEHDLAVVDSLVSRSNRGGRAVLEQQAVVDALARGT